MLTLNLIWFPVLRFPEFWNYRCLPSCPIKVFKHRLWLKLFNGFTLWLNSLTFSGLCLSTTVWVILYTEATVDFVFFKYTKLLIPWDLCTNSYFLCLCQALWPQFFSWLDLSPYLGLRSKYPRDLWIYWTSLFNLSDIFKIFLIALTSFFPSTGNELRALWMLGKHLQCYYSKQFGTVACLASLFPLECKLLESRDLTSS